MHRRRNMRGAARAYGMAVAVAALGVVNSVCAQTGWLRVMSVTETGSDVFVPRVTVKISDETGGVLRVIERVGPPIWLLVENNHQVEISAPEKVFKDIAGDDITDSVQGDPDEIKDRAEERFTASGISVNDDPQNDNTLCQFSMKTFEFKNVVVKWNHEYALTVAHDFTATQSPDTDGAGRPWAGPLTSESEGQPDPDAKKHWVRRGETRIAKIRGSVSRPGEKGELQIRYVPKSYVASGPPNRNTTELDDANKREAGRALETESFPFEVGQSPPFEQQVPEFAMYGPAKITYVWQIQFGVTVATVDQTRGGWPRVFRVGSDGKDYEVGTGQGTYWFDPSVRVKITAPARAPGDEGTALTGWINGDWHYFSGDGQQGDIDTESGQLLEGLPAEKDGSPVAIWRPVMGITPAVEQTYDETYRGLEIMRLARSALVQWQYGGREIRTEVTIGEHVFQGDEERLSVFTTEPDRIDRELPAAMTGEVDMAVWDFTAARLYPLVEGRFRATWRPDPEEDVIVEVIVTASYPSESHYPHVVGAPAVSLDPDPYDDFVFKELKYSESDASIDSDGFFNAGSAGRAVLLFGELQTVGRGEPREFLRVRVVNTKSVADAFATPKSTEVIVGRKILDPDLDLAGLGTGYVVYDDARHNPNIYDAMKLTGLAAPDVYDMDELRSTEAKKVVVNPGRLPGPIIPVNLHPGAKAEDGEGIVVMWYDDPAENDGLLWPHVVREYRSRWPTNATEGLGRIVISTQFGSESLDENGDEQVVVGGITNEVTAGDGSVFTNEIPLERTYNPSRLQEVMIYSQPDKGASGYNPNEEHAVVAPSLRYADVSPRPPAIYALRDNDLNLFNPANSGFKESLESKDTYSSHPFVLVQFKDVAENEYKMRVYKVQKEDLVLAESQIEYRFVFPAALETPDVDDLVDEPYVRMEAGEPVIPFYPLGVVIGAAPPSQMFGSNILDQTVYWEDWRESSWAVSGGEDAWFTHHVHYPMAPDFWWPPNESGFVTSDGKADEPGSGDPVSFLPSDISVLRAVTKGDPATDDDITTATLPAAILYKSDWPAVVPVLKAGETLTFQGGEYRADYPLTTTTDEDNNIVQVETPGLPAVVAFASAEIVYDSLNSKAEEAKWSSSLGWTARAAQVLEVRSVPLAFGHFPDALQPATKRTRVSGGKFVFVELPSSLQKRVRYDPLRGKLEMIGYLNEKDIGDNTLTAAPPAVYILEPNIITVKEESDLKALAPDETAWTGAVEELAKLSRNPSLIDSDFEVDEDTGDLIADLQVTWSNYYVSLGELAATAAVPPLVAIEDADNDYLVGLTPKTMINESDRSIVTTTDPWNLPRVVTDPAVAVPVRAFGPGLALLPNSGFLDPQGGLPEFSYITVVENNDPSLGGSPITPHVIKVDRLYRYRGSIKVVTSDNVFDENVVLRHTGDFGANPDQLYFEWWYRPDDGSIDVPPPDLIPSGQTNPWKPFPDPDGAAGLARFQVLLKGDPTAPETLLADSWWFARYRHTNDVANGDDWKVEQPTGEDEIEYKWAGAGNSDPLNDFDGDNLPDYKAQLSMGWIKRVLDAVNPYEARIRDFEGEAPSTISSMITEFGPRFEGAVALNPDKNVIESVGLIELYQTVLKRASDLSIDLSRPVCSPAIANALQLASTRISDFYMVLANEAYCDALDPTIGFGSSSAGYGSLAPAVFAFQNQVSSLIEEELGMLRGVDDYFARPVYNRLFWNFTKGEGEAAYANNYGITDINNDGFIDEDDAMILFPQGHGDAWGHYLTAIRMQYKLLGHKNFNWVSRSESYNLMDIVISVDFLDERKFAQMAAARAKAGAETVNLTYRNKYVEDPTAQWQGYTDGLEDRSWGVQGWARRTGQGAYFDWVTANALLPSKHPNENLEGIQRVDRTSNSDIATVSANLNRIQTTFDESNKGYSPLGLAGDVMPFDLNPDKVENIRIGRTHFEQIYDRAVNALKNTVAVWDNANKAANMLRKLANTEAAYRNTVFQGDLSYRNRLIKIFGKPYEGTIGSGKVYPAGYDGPDLLLYMYVDVRTIDNSTVPLPTTTFAQFDDDGDLTGGEIYDAYHSASGAQPPSPIPDLVYIPAPHINDVPVAFSVKLINDYTRKLFAPSFAPETANYNSYDDEGMPFMAQDQLYGVNYTDMDNPKVELDRLEQLMPVSAAGYTYQAPRDWGSRLAVGQLQTHINKMIQQEAQVAKAIGAWDGLQGAIVRKMRLMNAKVNLQHMIQIWDQAYTTVKFVIDAILKGIKLGQDIADLAKDIIEVTVDTGTAAIPDDLPTVGVAVSPGDAMFLAAAGVTVTEAVAKTTINGAKRGLKIASYVFEEFFELLGSQANLWKARENDAMAAREMLVALENMVGDEPIKRIAIFKEIEALRALSDEYVALVDEGARVIDEREAYNKRVAAHTQSQRYQDMTFRVSRNHSLQTYRDTFDLAAKYAYMAAKAYDYETNLDPTHPGSPIGIYSDIVRARGIGLVSGGVPRLGDGGLAEALAWMMTNYEVQKAQLGIMNPQAETGKMSLRTELFRILPKGYQGGGGGEFVGAGGQADALWKQTLQNARVDDLWMVPEFRYYCRPFAGESDQLGMHVAQPGLVFRFGTEITAGKNFFGKPLSGADHAYDPSLFATKALEVGIWLADYSADDVVDDLAEAPRVYLIPVGQDVLADSSSDSPGKVRYWNVIDQRIPTPLPSEEAELDAVSWVPLMDSLNGRLGDPRKYPSFRAYHDSSDSIEDAEMATDTRLVGRSVWNTEWLLIIPGQTLHASAETGLNRFVSQVSDIRLVFTTYGYSGN